MSRNLHDMAVVITGASAGIGRALAQALSARGARLVLASRRLDRLEALNASLGSKHFCVRCDVGITEDCRRLIAIAAERLGRIDTLVCNAGYAVVRPITDTTPREMRDIFATNVFGTTDCIGFAAPIMCRQPQRDPPLDQSRGQIMIVSSAAGRRGLPYFGAYSATKAAQLSIAEALRVELKPYRIAVTSVHPIGTHTDFFKTAEIFSNAIVSRGRTMEFRQTAETVARKMVRGIIHPRAELWPFPPARWGVSIGTMLPTLVDYVMGIACRQMETANGNSLCDPSQTASGNLPAERS